MNASERVRAAWTVLRQPLGTDTDPHDDDTRGAPESLPPGGFTPEGGPVAHGPESAPQAPR